MSKPSESDHGVTTALSDAYEKVAHSVTTAYAAARGRAAEVGQGTASGIDASPLLALVGGLAIGAIAGALVPRGERENGLLAPVGARIADAATAAIAAARSTGAEALAEAGISEENLRTQASNLVEQLVKAAAAAGTAAVNAARDGATK